LRLLCFRYSLSSCNVVMPKLGSWKVAIALCNTVNSPQSLRTSFILEKITSSPRS
jgi:hypothetical protein